MVVRVDTREFRWIESHKQYVKYIPRECQLLGLMTLVTARVYFINRQFIYLVKWFNFYRSYNNL